MAEGLVNEVREAAVANTAGAGAIARLGQVVGLYLETPRPGRDLPDWDGLDAAGRELLAQDFDRWALIPDAAAVAVRAAQSLQLRSAVRLGSAVNKYYNTIPIDEAERKWLLGAYGQIMRTSGRTEPSALVATLREQREEVTVHEQLLRFWWWSQGPRTVETRRTEFDGGKLLASWWDWRRGAAGYFYDGEGYDRVDEGPTFHEMTSQALQRLHAIVTGASEDRDSGPATM